MKDEQANEETLGIDAQIDFLCTRPAVLTGHHTLDAVWVYLPGLYNALEWCRESPEAAAAAAPEFQGFFGWLREKFLEHYDPREVFRADSSSDKEALENLAARWAEYRARAPR